MFLLLFLNPNDLKTTKSSIMSANSTAAELKTAVKSYYETNGFIKSTIDTNRTWFDADGTETTDYAEAVSSVYYITVNKLIASPTVSSINVIKATTKSTIVVDIPADVQLSGEPLSGNYKIECNKEGFLPTYSSDLDYRWNSGYFPVRMASCGGFGDLIEFEDVAHYPYPANGRAFLLRFVGLNEKPA